MKSQCQNLAESIVATAPLGFSGFLSSALSENQAQKFRDSLCVDATCYFYSSAITLASAVNGIERGFYSWSIVQFYYSMFYSLRAWLASDGYGIAYIAFNNKSVPLFIDAKPGSTPQKEKEASTHKLCLKHFSRIEPASPYVTQEIDGEPPLKWLMRQREKANYNVPRMPEPSAPDCYYQNIKQVVQNRVALYYSDKSYTYAFLKEDAVVALPIAIFRDLASKLRPRGLIGQSDYDAAKDYFKLKSGAYSLLVNELRYA